MRTPNETWRRGNGCRLRICLTCGEGKPISEYYVNSNNNPHSHCKPCFRALARQRYKLKKAALRQP